VEDTWRWFHDAGLATSQAVDWTLEDEILALLDD